METQQVVEYASLNRRMIAACIDTFIIFMLFSPILNYVDNYIFHGRTPQAIMQEIAFQYQEIEMNIDSNVVVEKLRAEKIWTKVIMMHVITVMLLAIYSIGFWYKFSATPGKYLCSCKIVNQTNLEKPSLIRFITRFLGYLVFLGMGFITVSFTKQKQALHDKMAKTLVIVVKSDFKWLAKVGISNIKS
jgi:uncharacterized RDD family membrane protein YckC